MTTFHSRVIAAVAVIWTATAAHSIGLTPLEKEGNSRSDRKGFYLTVLNEGSRSIVVDAHVMADEFGNRQRAVKVMPEKFKVGPKSARKIVLVIGNLDENETREVSVCVSTRKRNTNTLLRICGDYRAFQRR